MVSALPLCLFVLAMTVVSSQEISGESEFAEQTPMSERRSFKHKKPFKVLPLIKKHKKFGGWLPSVFGKTEYAEVPVYQEIPVRPIYKFQRYHGFDVKPVSTVHSVSFSGPETIVESNSVEHSSDYAPAYTSDHDYVPTFTSDHSFPPAPPPSSSFFLYPLNDKPVFSGPAHVFPSPAPSLPSPPAFDPIPSFPRPIFSYAPSAPIFSSLPISIPPVTLPPAPVFSTVSIAKPAPTPIISAPVHPEPPALPVLSAPSFSLPLPAPTPAPAFSFPVRFPPAFFPAPSPAPAFSPISVLPSPSPAPAFSSVSVLPSPSTPVFSPHPSPSPASLPALSIPVSHGHEYPYPPSGAPVSSYVKDISLPEISVTPTPNPTSVSVVTPHYEEVTKTLGDVEHTKTFDHGLLQKLKDWKAEKANQAISHFSYFKPKPAIAAVPTLASPHHASIQFSNPVHSLPLTPDFKPPSFFFSPAKYENFPPNNIESPPLFNSYGVPIPPDSYSTIHSSHDRLSPEASEEDPSILPPPQSLGESKPEADSIELKKPEIQQPQTELRLGFQPQNFKPQFQPQAILPQEQPIYVPEENQKINEETKTIEVVTPVKNSQPEEAEEPEDPNLQHHSNHKE